MHEGRTVKLKDLGIGDDKDFVGLSLLKQVGEKVEGAASEMDGGVTREWADPAFNAIDRGWPQVGGRAQDRFDQGRTSRRGWMGRLGLIDFLYHGSPV